MNFDIIVPVHLKDENKLKFLIPSIQKNIFNYENIFVISDFEILNKFENITYIQDGESLKLNERTRKIWDSWKEKNDFTRQKPNWIYQQFIKLFNKVSDNDYLVIDSDVVILKPLQIIENNKPSFFLGRDQNHHEYFNFSKKIMNLEKVYSHSFISELMFFNKKMIKSFLEHSSNGDYNLFIEKSLSIIHNDCFISEYEIYGNFITKYFPESYNYKNLNVHFNGKIGSWSDNEISNLINSQKNSQSDILTVHSW